MLKAELTCLATKEWPDELAFDASPLAWQSCQEAGNHGRKGHPAHVPLAKSQASGPSESASAFLKLTNQAGQKGKKSCMASTFSLPFMALTTCK